MLQQKQELVLQENFGTNMVKKIDNETKTGIDASKTTSERVVQKNAEAEGDLIRNKRRWKTRNLHTTRKNTEKYWWL